MSKARPFILLISLLGATIAGPGAARADVELTFYAHPGARLRQGWLLFPHAYIGLTGTLSSGERVEEYLGFTAANPGPHLLITSGRGALLPPDMRYFHESRRGLSVTLADQTYWTIDELIATWRNPASSVYNLRSRNCITFVAEVAKAAGLALPDQLTLSPARFLDDLAQKNHLSNVLSDYVDLEGRPRGSTKD